MNTIKVEKLTEDSFAAFGDILSTEGRDYSGEEGVFKWYEKQSSVTNSKSVSVNLLTVIEREMICQKFEAHKLTTETILPLTGDVIVAGIPPGEINPNLIRAFYVPVGMGVSWAPSVWHYAPYPIGGDATCAIIFRHGTGEDDAIFADLPNEIRIVV